MNEIEETLARWNSSLVESVDVGGLISRNPTAHKWKATYRSLVVREACLWRMHDLGVQIVGLAKSNHFLGARILLRAALETAAILIYLNHKTKKVIAGDLSFFEFDETSKKLIMGSRNEGTSVNSINIVSVIQKADKEHEGLLEMYETLCETAHPNYDGVLYGYTKTNWEEYETSFQNNWAPYFEKTQGPGTNYVFAVFEHEYNNVWPDVWEGLEQWLENNDTELEATKSPNN